MQPKVCFIVFSGFNERSITCFFRTLRHLDIPFCIIALSKKDPFSRTDYAKNIILHRQHATLELADIDACLEKVKNTIPADQYIIAPSSEFLNIFLLNNQLHFKAMGIEIPLPNKIIYKKLSDKKVFTELCRARRILVPEEINPRELTENLPFVAKPKTDITDDGIRVVPEIIETENARKQFNTHDANLYFYQQYIKGPSFYFLIYRHANGQVDAFSQQNLLQQPNGKSIVLATTSNIHLTEEITPYLNMLSSLDFRGLIMIELKKQDGKFYMIEANPRMWGPAQLMADAGNNLFISFINDRTGSNFPFQTECKSQRYLWSGGIAETLEHGEKLDAYAEPHEIFEALNATDLQDIYGRSDTEPAFKSKVIELNTNNIRKVF